jgi:hypothetical protein
MKQIILQYPAKCRFKGCNRTLEAGEWALWGKDIGAICVDHLVEKLGDRALVAKYLKVREMRVTLKALQNEADRLAGKVETFAVMDKIEQMSTKNVELYKLAIDYMKQPFLKPEEQEAMKELTEAVKREDAVIEDIERYLERMLNIKKKVKPPEIPSY